MCAAQLQHSLNVVRCATRNSIAWNTVVGFSAMVVPALLALFLNLKVGLYFVVINNSLAYTLYHNENGCE